MKDNVETWEDPDTLTKATNKVVFKDRIDKAITLSYGIMKSMDRPHLVYFTKEDLFVVWFSKTLQNWKALVSGNFTDAPYIEVTYNGDKKETYFDIYSKLENIVIPD
jgi:Family of unknown function (DUF6275)